MSPDEFLASVEQQRASGPAALLSPEDFLAQQTPAPAKDEYSTGEKAGDLARTGIKSVLALPRALGGQIQKAAAGVEMIMRTPEAATNAFLAGDGGGADAFSETMSKPSLSMAVAQHAVTPAGDWVNDALARKIPKDAAGGGFEALDTAARVAGQFAFPGALGGKVMSGIQKAGAFTFGTAGGVVGQELAGDVGEVAGAVVGDMVGTNPAAALRAVPGAFSVAGDVAKDTYSAVFRRNPTLDNANEQELADTFANLSSHFDMRDKKTPEEATTYIKEMFDKIMAAKHEGSTLTMGQITGDAGILNFEARLADDAFAKTANNTKNRADAANEMSLKRARLKTETEKPMLDIAPEGNVEEALALPAAKAREKQAGILSKSEAAAEPLVPAAEGRLNKAVAAEAAVPAANSQSIYQAAAQPGVKIDSGDAAGFRQLDDSVNAGYKAAWKGVDGVSPHVIGDLNTRINSLMRSFNTGSDAHVLNKLLDDINHPNAVKGKKALRNLDRRLRDAAADAPDAVLSTELAALRPMMRKGLPAKNRKDLKAMDSKYSTYLIAQKMAKSANLHDGEAAATAMATAIRGGDTGRKVARGEAPGTSELDAAVSATADAKTTTAGAKEGVRTAKTQADELRKQAADDVKTVKNSGPGMFTSTNPHLWRKKVKKVLADDLTIERATELVESTKGSPEAREHLRRAFAEDLHLTVTKTGKIDENAVKNFKAERAVYEKSGLFSKAELDRVQAGMEEAKKLYLHKPDQIAKLPKERRRLLEIFAGLAGAKAGAFAFGSPLIGAAYGRKMGTELADKLTKGKIDDLSYELVANPEKFKDIFEKLEKASVSKKAVDSALSEMYKRLPGALASGGRVAVGQEDE